MKDYLKMFDGQHRSIPQNRKQRRSKTVNKDPRFPDRPDHPDFWRLSEVVKANDARADALTDEDALEALLAKYIDVASLVYMAGQRAIRTPEAGSWQQAYATVWIDAFLAGIEYQKAVSEGR